MNDINRTKANIDMLDQGHMLNLSDADLDDLIESEYDTLSALAPAQYGLYPRYSVWKPGSFILVTYDTVGYVTSDVATRNFRDEKSAAEYARAYYHSLTVPCAFGFRMNDGLCRMLEVRSLDKHGALSA